METSYRLDEYKITEAGVNEIRWEAHFGLGAFQTGKCFRKGSILFIGPTVKANAGFLKGEFLDRIDKLPFWSKTPYYCKGCDIYHCTNGDRVSMEEMLCWMLERDHDRYVSFDSKKSEKVLDKVSGTEARADIVFRLQRYKIVKKSTGEVCWITHAGPKSGVRGNCIILEDILFIESFQSKPSALNKRSFQADLRRLSIWDQTQFYAPKLSLFDCKSGCRILTIEKPKKKKVSKEQNQDFKNRKRVVEVAIPETSPKKKFSEAVSGTMNSISRFAATYRSRARSLWLKCKEANIPKPIAEMRFTRFWRWITWAIVLIILMITFLFTFLIGVWHERSEKSHHKKGEHGSGYHRDD